jgi:FAD/FMN-containing dehydrogenase
MVVKAWPEQTRIGGLTFYLTTGTGKTTLPGSRGYPSSPPVHVADAETFWKAYRTYLAFAKEIVDAGGFGFGDVNPQGNNTYVFVATITLPNFPSDRSREFYTPLFDSLRELGVDVPNPRHSFLPYAQRGIGVTPTSFPGSPADLLFISRLLPRSLWANKTRLDAVAAVNRQNAEMGYRVTARVYGPSATVAGYPGNTTSAVNPAMRSMVIHCVTFKQEPVDLLPPAEFRAEHAKLRSRIDELVRLTPESGSYFNEADISEPDWQKSFWGEHYPRLLSIKKAVDPWGLFWAPTTVGSEAWEVVTSDMLPTQNGPLCRNGT